MVGLAFSIAGCGGGGGGSQAPGPAEPSPPVGAEDMALNQGHYDDVLEMLRGLAPGLQMVRESGGGATVRIRGFTQSLGGASGQEPLVVIDGIPSSRPAGDALLALRPTDVASITVLRDVASTVVFGIRGANGVILVNTKRKGRG